MSGDVEEWLSFHVLADDVSISISVQPSFRMLHVEKLKRQIMMIFSVFRLMMGSCTSSINSDS
jgi:hypothetical protein